MFKKKMEGVAIYMYTVCGLYNGCGLGVEMCDIYNDFDKHCLLCQKRLILGNIKIIMYKFAN